MSEIERASTACWTALAVAMCAGLMVALSMMQQASELVVIAWFLKMVLWIEIGLIHNREVIRLEQDINTFDYEDVVGLILNAEPQQ